MDTKVQELQIKEIRLEIVKIEDRVLKERKQFM